MVDWRFAVGTSSAHRIFRRLSSKLGGGSGGRGGGGRAVVDELDVGTTEETVAVAAAALGWDVELLVLLVVARALGWSKMPVGFRTAPADGCGFVTAPSTVFDNFLG